MRWTVGLVCGFLVVFAVNGLLIYLAVSGADPVVPSYLESQER